MTVQLEIELPEDAFSVLKIGPKDFVREMKLAAVVKWYEMGMISQSKASELAGLSRRGFLEALKRFEISPFQTSPEELEREIADA